MQYTDPVTNIQWVKNYHVRTADGTIVEAACQNSGGWTASTLSSTITGDRNGGLAAFVFLDDDTGLPVVRLMPHMHCKIEPLKLVIFFEC